MAGEREKVRAEVMKWVEGGLEHKEGESGRQDGFSNLALFVPGRTLNGSRRDGMGWDIPRSVLIGLLVKKLCSLAYRCSWMVEGWMDGRTLQCILEKMIQNRSRRVYRIECSKLLGDIDASVFCLKC